MVTIGTERILQELGFKEMEIALMREKISLLEQQVEALQKELRQRGEK